jgi:hypothetical protein
MVTAMFEIAEAEKEALCKHLDDKALSTGILLGCWAAGGIPRAEETAKLHKPSKPALDKGNTITDTAMSCVTKTMNDG